MPLTEYAIPLRSSWCPFYQIYTQISSKITIFEHTIKQGNATLCRKNMHQLLLKCFISSLRYIRVNGSASDSVSDSHKVNTVSFYQNYSQISSIITHFGHQISPENVMLYAKDRHPMLLAWFITSLRCLGIIQRATVRIYDSLMVVIGSFIPIIPSNVKQNNKFEHQISLENTTTVSWG